MTGVVTDAAEAMGVVTTVPEPEPAPEPAPELARVPDALLGLDTAASLELALDAPRESAPPENFPIEINRNKKKKKYEE